MMHARFATCGNKDDVSQSHPYAVKRDGQVKIFGAHNGVIREAFESAKAHNRHIDVDSQEVFELLVDKEFEAIQKLSGYGVLTYIDAAERDHINLVKLSYGGDIVVVKLKEGGVVWASNWSILNDGLKMAGLTADSEYKDMEVGHVYRIQPDGMFKTKIEGIKLNSGYTSRSHWQGNWAPSKASDDKTPTTTAWNPSSHDATKLHNLHCTCAGCKNKYSGANDTHKPYDHKITNHRGSRFVPIGDGKTERINGDIEYYLDGQLHRVDGPAVERKNGDKEWYLNGKRHRIGGPAIEKPNGDTQYFAHGEFHREDGPAIEFQQRGDDAPKWEGYYLEGEFYKTKELWEAALSIIVELRKLEETETPDKKDLPKEKEIAQSKDHAFMREMQQFWDKWEDEEEEDGWGTDEDNRFLLKGIMG